MNIENKILQGNFLFVFIIVMFILKISINNLDNWRIIEERKSNLFMYNINLPDLGLYFMDNSKGMKKNKLKINFFFRSLYHLWNSV